VPLAVPRLRLAARFVLQLLVARCDLSFQLLQLVLQPILLAGRFFLALAQYVPRTPSPSRSVQRFSHFVEGQVRLSRSAPPRGEPKLFALTFMPLRSLRPGGSCPDSGACPTSCRRRGAVWLPPASAPTCHRGTLLPLAFFVALRAASVPAGYSFASTASARAGTRSSTGSPRSRPAPVLRHRPVSFATCSAFCRAAVRSSCA